MKSPISCSSSPTKASECKRALRRRHETSICCFLSWHYYRESLGVLIFLQPKQERHRCLHPGVRALQRGPQRRLPFSRPSAGTSKEQPFLSLSLSLSLSGLCDFPSSSFLAHTHARARGERIYSSSKSILVRGTQTTDVKLFEKRPQQGTMQRV